ncbi:hypothetical protein L1987_76981 [Smallanthus sonchifolius]|uniref:Uncharacterized protein n=1 Tax=Smallanthus sonchifolius TaxID=185202 RepID=A0ACB8Z9J8_9ASTR|nr:hypothetical protein L1987_76981 [Smallanthus sonchifolius]
METPKGISPGNYASPETVTTALANENNQRTVTFILPTETEDTKANSTSGLSSSYSSAADLIASSQDLLTEIFLLLPISNESMDDLVDIDRGVYGHNAIHWMSFPNRLVYLKLDEHELVHYVDIDTPDTTIYGTILDEFLAECCDGDKYLVHKQSPKWITVLTMAPPRQEKGGGVMDKSVIEKTTPSQESEFELKKSRKMAPPYRVRLHNDSYNKRGYVVQVLMKVIPGMTVDNAFDIMQEAHINGLAVVIVCGQADVEEHCTQLRGNGLLSSIEPDSGGC